ncbi:hypothetical protein IFM89_001841 [Coptis chinensis]|uniref:Ribosomal RNA small subunit methyltransferase NEP1 n=1 Tax=Coptis chinensis TaxID=261450 RepID=A0A835HIG6_9MAGN|nr:hypothetical protein IFM89_001841 [Coptis chinensis]
MPKHRKRIKENESVRDGKRRRKINVDTRTPTITEEQEENLTEEEPLGEQHEAISVATHTQDVKKAHVTFILENASLKKGVVGKSTKILNSDEHANFLLKQKKNLDDFRPDILHRALLGIFDSPLSKLGMVEAVYVKIDNGVLFEVKPHVRIPRTIKRFYGLMLELLQKSRITTNDTHETLLRVIEQPVTRHLPAKSQIIGLSYGLKKQVNLKDYIAAVRDDVNLVFVVSGSFKKI